MIGIKEARLETLNITDEPGKGPKAGGTYSIIATNDKVLAKQSFNSGYGSVEIALSSETHRLMDSFRTSLKNDIANSMGLGGEA